MKAVLLRVGIDKGTDDALGPIFEDGSFEYIPLSENCPSREKQTFKNTLGCKGKPLAAYLPRGVAEKIIHFDPEFEGCTYGDSSVKRKYLLKLNEGDLLVFYAGLSPFETKRQKEALYIIGYFTVERGVDFNQLSKSDMKRYYQVFSTNSHMKRKGYPKDLVIVAGAKAQSRLLEKAIMISETKRGKNDRPYQAVSEEMEKKLGVSGSIQRSVPPRTITGKRNIRNLTYLLGLQDKAR